MMSYISCTEVIGAKLEQEMLIDTILNYLYDSFDKFKMAYDMNKLNLTLTELMHELESVERSLVKLGCVYHAKTSSKPKGPPKSGREGEQEKKRASSTTKPVAMKKPKVKCFNCCQKDLCKKVFIKP